MWQYAYKIDRNLVAQTYLDVKFQTQQFFLEEHEKQIMQSLIKTKRNSRPCCLVHQSPDISERAPFMSSVYGISASISDAQTCVVAVSAIKQSTMNRSITSRNHDSTAKPRVPLQQRLSFSVGHILNDLVTNAWNSYWLVFLTKVQGLPNAVVAYVMFAPFAFDAVCTPVAAVFCDRTVCRYGRRKIWHLAATLVVSLTFPFMFIRCIFCSENSTSSKVLYCASLGMITAVSWGITQTAHLALLTEVTPRESERMELISIRSALTFLCGIYVYAVTWILLGQSEEVTLSPNIWKQFMYLGFIVVGTGTLFNIIFHVATTEPPSPALIKWKQKNKARKQEKDKNEMKSLLEVTWRADSSGKQNGALPFVVTRASKTPAAAINSIAKCEGRMQVKTQRTEILEKTGNNTGRTWKHWLKEPGFYKVGSVYTCSRLVVNISQSYFPLYLTETLQFEKEAIAYFPLVVLVTGVVASTCVKPLNTRLGSKITFCLGSMLAICACFWFYLQSIEARSAIYVPAILMGCGGSIMLVTSLSLIAELIGSDQKSGAFVYGAISFTDKLTCGGTIAIIQKMNPRTNMTTECVACEMFLRNVQTFAPGAAAGVALVLVILFFDTGFTCKKKVERCEIAVQTNLEDESSEHEDEPNEHEDESSEHEDESTMGSFPSTIEYGDEDETLSSSREKNSYISFETKNLLLLPRAMESYAATRLASPFVPSPLLERRAGRK